MERINDLKISKAGERNSMLIYIFWLDLLRFLFRNETIEDEILYIFNNLSLISISFNYYLYTGSILWLILGMT